MNRWNSLSQMIIEHSMKHATCTCSFFNIPNIDIHKISLGHSLFKQKFSQKFLCFFVLFCFFVFCVFYFIKISKFALPGVMLIYERTSKDRKKEIER